MAIKKYKPTTPWRRQMTWIDYSELSKVRPFWKLLSTLKSNSWRNNKWRITVRHKWGGHKKRYRHIDFFRIDKKGVEAKVETIEYDPYRSAFIALVCYSDWERRYILANTKMKVWDKLVADDSVKILPWNRMLVSNIPLWMQVYNLELMIWEWGSIIRSAGSSWTVISQEWKYTQIKLPSGQVRYVHKRCYATLWQVSNPDHWQIVLWKAWRSRHMWKRPVVRGKAMNPVDHPHGWGEWRSPIGMAHPKTKWWAIALWWKTRRNKRTEGWISKKAK